MISTNGLMVGASLLAVLCATVWAEFDSRLDKQWDLWKKTHQKNYQNEVEEMGRRALWEKNLNHINLHNLEATLGLHTYTLAVNHLSDLTASETRRLSAPMKLPENFEINQTPLNVTERALPPSIDWRQAGYVTSVKDQGDCGSCWAFSTVEALEGLWAKTRRELVDLSPQNLVDCSKAYGNNGCEGGEMHQAFQYIISNDGIQSEVFYPYEGVDHRQCRYNPAYKKATCSSYHMVPQNELSLQQAVATHGPIAIGINLDDASQYSSGVYGKLNCGQEINHAVLLVGYGTDDSGREYWLIKNSWGTDWGERGYMRIARNNNQMCGISLYSVFPL